MGPPFLTSLRRVGAVTLLGVLPALFLVLSLAVGMRQGAHETIDFRVFYDAAGAYLHGHGPYPLHADSLTWSHGAQHSYAYPPIVAALLVPFRLAPYHLAAIFWVLMCAGAVGLALWLLEIRDWRCYGAFLLWPSTLSGISIGTVSPLLLLGVAAAWRLRNRASTVAAVAALTVSAKLFLWPLLIWLWSTGRRLAALGAAVLGATAAVLAWWWIGFAGAGSYVELLRRLTAVEAPQGYAPFWQLAGLAALAVAAAAYATVAYFTRRREREAFAMAIIAALLLTPILWLHYLLLLAAALPRRFSVIWVAPVLLWLTPQQGAYGDAWHVALVAGVIGIAGVSARREARSATGVIAPAM